MQKLQANLKKHIPFQKFKEFSFIFFSRISYEYTHVVWVQVHDLGHF